MKMTTKAMLVLCADLVIVVLLSQAGYAGLSGTAFAAALVAGCALVIAMGLLLNRGISGIIDKTYWYQHILDAIPFHINVTDMNMKWTFMNKAFEKALVKEGRIKSRTEAMGQPCSNAHTVTCNTDGCGVKQLQKGEPVTYFDSGAGKWRQDVSYIINDRNEKIGHVEITQDLTSIISINEYTKKEVDRLSRNLEQLACGNMEFDLSVTEADQYSGKVKEDFVRINNSLNKVHSEIGALIDDAAMLSEAAIEGKLDTRVDAARHCGDFRKIAEGLNHSMDAVAEPVNELMTVLDRVTVNDLTQQMVKEYHGIWNDLKNASNGVIRLVTHVQDTVMRISNGDLSDLELDKKIGRRCENDQLMPAMIKMMEVIRAMVDDAEMLVGAATAGKLDVRADAARHSGEYRKIIEEFNNTLDAVTGPLKVAAEYVDRISKGDIPPKISESYTGDFNEIKNNLNTCIDSINSVVGEMNNLYEAQSAGDADFYINEERFSGVYRQMATGVNESVKIHVRNTLKILKVVFAYAEGDFSKILEKLPGKQIVANEKMDLLRNNLLNLIKEINNLVQAVRDGKLDTRGNAAAFTGDWGKLVGDMNSLMAAVAEPVNELRAILGRIAVNDVTKKMDKEYAGIWNNLKDDTSRVIAIITSIQDVSKNMSNGNLSDLDMLKQIGRRSDNDKLTPTYIQMMEAIQNLVKDANTLAQSAVEGKLDTRADASKHEGDYRKIIDGFNKTLDAVVNPIHEAVECLKEMAGGNLDVAVTGDYKGDHAIIKNALNKTLIEVNEILGQISIAIEQVNTGAWQVSDSSQSLSQGAAESAGTMEQLTSSMNEMNSQTKQNAENAMQANQLATQARGIAEKGNGQMAQMVKAMSDINESAANVSKIIKAIDEIAFQTNILALNAAVEAARAGKHGKGFTVVAEEVRNLAQRSAKAAKETAEMIEGSIKKTEVGAKIAEETSRALEEIMLGTTKVTDLIGEIAAASKEQAVGIGQINEGLNQVDQVTQQNSAGSEELAAASEEMSSQAAMVKQMLEKFKLRKQGFTGASAVMADTGTHAAPPRPVQKQTWSGKNKLVKMGALEAAAAKGTGLRPQDIISLNDVEFGNF